MREALSCPSAGRIVARGIAPAGVGCHATQSPLPDKDAIATAKDEHDFQQ